MGTSYVELNDRGFWAHDTFLEGLYFLLAREFNKIEDKQVWQKELITKFNSAATADFIGCVPSYLYYFDTSDKIELLRKSLLYIQKELCENPNFLNNMEFPKGNLGNVVWVNLTVKRYINITRLTLDLINGHLTTDASSPIDYWIVE